MKSSQHTILRHIALTVLTASTYADMPPPLPTASVTQQRQAIGTFTVATNQAGTDAMALATATNFAAGNKLAIGRVTIDDTEAPHAAPEPSGPTSLSKIARVGTALVVVEKDGQYAWREQPSEQGIRTVKLGTIQLAALHRLWTGQPSTGQDPTGPVLETTVKWDTATGSYEMSRMELGLFDRQIWLLYEQADDDQETIGMQYKQDW